MKRTIAFLLALMGMLVWSAVAIAEVRGPIQILGNFDLTEENGVVGGNGTDEDPYVIANWEIAVPEGERYGVRIENVTVPFVLRGVIITNAYEFDGAGIHIGYSESGSLEGCSISNSLNGIHLVSSIDITIDSCILYVSGLGLQVEGERAEEYRHVVTETTEFNGQGVYYYYGLNGETISGLEGGHLTVAGSKNVVVRQNVITNGDGINLAYVEDSTVQTNLTRRTADVPTRHGLSIYASQRIEILSNIFQNSRFAGIQLSQSSECTVSGNSLLSNDRALHMAASNANIVRDNVVYNNESGFVLGSGSQNNIIEANRFVDDRQFMAVAVKLEQAYNNVVRENLVTGAEVAIWLEALAVGNTIADNTLVQGAYGIQNAGAENIIERNLISQFSRGVVFEETFGRSITENNEFRGNVFADNENHLYTNLDSRDNLFTQNLFFGRASVQVADNGEDNIWTENGLGNYWADSTLGDADGDGIADGSIPVYPADVDDTAPLARLDMADYGVGVLSTLETIQITIEPSRGADLRLDVLYAASNVSRATGYRGFPDELMRDAPGVLFHQPEETESSFIMQTVLFDLDIAFFDVNGEWVSGATMAADNGEERVLYASSDLYLYALELPAGSLEEFGIGSGSKLILP